MRREKIYFKLGEKKEAVVIDEGKEKQWRS